MRATIKEHIKKIEANKRGRMIEPAFPTELELLRSLSDSLCSELIEMKKDGEVIISPTVNGSLIKPNF